MPRCKAYETAAEAITVAKLASAGRLIAVAPELTTNGDGFVICDGENPAKLWDANGNAWQARVHASTDDKFKIVLERWGTNERA